MAAHFSLFDLDRIHLLPGLQTDEPMKERVLKASSDHEDSLPIVASEATALLQGFEIVGCEHGTEITSENVYLGKSSHWERDTMIGSYQDFEYALIQRKENCEVHLRSKPGVSPAQGATQKVMAALLRAVAFAHGQHAWPQWQQFRHDGRTVKEYVASQRSLARSKFPPLTDRLATNGSALNTFLERALPVFLSETEFAANLEHQISRHVKQGSMRLRSDLVCWDIALPSKAWLPRCTNACRRQMSPRTPSSFIMSKRSCVWKLRSDWR